MNFFEQITALHLQGDVNIVINATEKDNIKVSVHFKNEQAGNKGNALPPLTLSGTPQEFDETFFTVISEPLKKTSGILVNLAAYQKAQDELKKQPKESKTNNVSESKKPNEKEKKYEEAMKVVADLEAQGKFREAYGKVPQGTAFPNHEAELAEKKNELLKRFAADIFAA